MTKIQMVELGWQQMRSGFYSETIHNRHSVSHIWYRKEDLDKCQTYTQTFPVLNLPTAPPTVLTLCMSLCTMFQTLDHKIKSLKYAATVEQSWKAYAGFGRAESHAERHSFVLRRHHANDFFLWSKVEPRYAFEALLQMRLNAQRIFRFWQDFQQLIVGKKKEPSIPKTRRYLHWPLHSTMEIND